MTHTQLTQLVQALLDAPTSNETVKEFAQSWINAEGTPKQEELTKQLVSVAEQNIALIDETIGFAGSELATQILGAEGAANLLQHAKDIKAEGAEFCDCPACVAAKILSIESRNFIVLLNRILPIEWLSTNCR